LERFQAADQGRALDMRAAQSVVGEYLFASGLLQSRVLHIGVLVVGRNSRVTEFPRVAVFHRLILHESFAPQQAQCLRAFERWCKTYPF
jgi:hypothetical protein